MGSFLSSRTPESHILTILKPRITMGVAITTIAWFCIWLEIEPISAFRIGLASLYVVLVNIMICRVFRNTKLGLYNNTVPLSRSYDTPLNGSISWNSRHEASDTARVPIQISVNQVVEYKNDYPPTITAKRPVDYLDFGMV